MRWFNKNEYKTYFKQKLNRNNIKWYREYKAKNQPNIRAKFGQRPIWDDKIAEGFIKEYPDKKFRNSIKYQNSYI